MAAPDQQPRDTADLELSLAPTSSGFSLTLRYRRPGDAGEDVRGPFPVALDPAQLRSLSLNHAGYGTALADQLFGDPQARRDFIAICDGTFEAGERLRIRFHLHDPALHTIRWELLHDPARGTPLARDTRLLVSRFISAERRGRVELRPRGALRALVAVAAPTYLPDYNLAPIDASAEIARVRAALTGIAVDSLGDGQPCTLNTLGEQLRRGAGYDILYLVAHGALVDGQPQLYLAGDDHTAVVEDGNKLADLLGSLHERQPRLVVLASCASAGDGASDTLTALGPLLANIGVPAVLAMQGQIRVITIEQLMPVFFRELLRDGLADWALAVAHLAVRDRDDWWMPVLFTRLRDGRIWSQSDDSAAVPLGLASPYRALNAFTINDTDLFFGRDALIKEGYERWLASDRRFLAVVGASGSGKSSLAQAGLLPHLQRDLAEQRFAPHTIIVRPGERPLRALRDALRREGLPVAADFAERLATEPSLLLQTLQQATAQERGTAITLLVIDQFEELFTLCNDEAERLAFDAALAHAEEQSSGTVSIIITLRSDFYRHSATLALREQIATYQVHVRNLLPAEMQQAISGPVRAVAGDGPPHFEAGLVEQMIEETGSSPGALPLLSVALSRLWEAGALDLITYRRLGGVRGALEKQAEQLYAELPADDQRAARQLLLQLVQLGEGNEDTRRRVPLNELTPAWRTPAQTQSLVKKLSDARLISTSEASEPVVEVSHEALIRGWGRLRSWLEEDRAIVSLHRQISAATQLWRDGNQDVSLLWLGARLANAEEQGSALAGRLTHDEHTFLIASRAEQQRQIAKQRRGQAIAAIAVVAVIAVLALGGLAGVIWRQGQDIAIERDNAQQAQQTAVIAQQTAVAAQAQVEQLQHETLSRRLAAESQALRDNQYGYTILLAIQALRVATTAEADGAVRTWLDNGLYSVDSSMNHNGDVWGASWNADESRILTWSEDGTAKLWDEEGQLLAVLPHTGSVKGANWNRDESRILTWSNDGTAKLWDGEGQLLATLPHSSSVMGASWNADESRIFTWSENTFFNTNIGRAKLWDGEGQLLATLPHSSPIMGANWNAVDSRILTWGPDDKMHLWDGEGQLLATLPHNGSVRGASWHKDGSRILTWSGYPFSSTSTATLWDREGLPLATLPHSLAVNGAKWNTYGNRILTWSEDGTAKLWDGKGQLLAIMQHSSSVVGANWNQEESYILTWSGDRTAKLWDQEGQLLATLPHDNPVTGAIWSEGKSQILTWSQDGTTKLWDREGQLLGTLLHDDSVTGARWSKDESRLLTWTEYGTAKLWDGKGQPLATLAEDGSVTGAIWSKDERRLLTWGGNNSSNTGTAKLWERKGQPLATLAHDNIVWDARWNADESRILTWSFDGKVKQWDPEGQYISTIPFDHNIWGASWNADESQVLTWGDNNALDTGVAKLWNREGQLLATLPHHDFVTGAWWNKDGSRILTWSEDRTAKLWDEKGQLLATLAHRDFVTGAWWNKDESRILTWSEDGTAKLWAGEGQLLATLLHQDSVLGVNWNKEESRILTWSEDGTAKLWDQEGQLLVTLLHQDIVRGARWSKDESRILTWGGYRSSNTGTAKIWDEEGKLLVTLPHHADVLQAWWNKDENRILTLGGDFNSFSMAKLWDEEGQLLATLPHSDYVRGISWNKDESRILTWSEDGTAKLWDGEGQLLATLRHNGNVWGAQWNKDENRILTWSDDDTAKVWDRNGQPLITLPHYADVFAVSWNKDESRILTWGGDSTVKIHLAESEDLIVPACRMAPRNFALDEWSRYMGNLPYRRTCTNVPLHPSYGEDVAARLKSGQISEAEAIAEVARALQVDPYATSAPPTELVEEAKKIVAELLK